MSEPSADLCEALGLLEAALKLIDRADAPGEIGAHVDLAIQRLARMLGRSGGAHCDPHF